MKETRQFASLLMDLANLYATDEAAVRRIQTKWPDLVPEVRSLDLPPPESVSASFWPEANKHLWALGQLVRLIWFGQLIPEAWRTADRILFPPDGRQRASVDWKYRKITYTPQTTVEELLYFLLQNGDRARRCANNGCVRPFFIAKQPNERYCSDACAQNVQRLAKATWWRESGKEWRKSKKSGRKK